jgi:hypothetical protein
MNEIIASQIVNELTVYSPKDLMSDTSMLTTDQAELIAYSLGREWQMPTFKAKHFVGNAQIHPYSKLKQYLLEINSRESALERMIFDYKKIDLALRRAEHKITITEGFDREEAEIERDEELRKKKSTLHKLKDLYNERQVFLDLVEEFNNSEEGRMKDGTLIMDAIKDRNKEEELERDYWTLRLAKQSACDMIAYGRIGVGNMEAVSMLDARQQEEVFQLAADYVVRNENRMRKWLTVANDDVRKNLTASELTQKLYLDEE